MTIDHSVKDIDYNIEIDQLIDPDGEDVTSEIYLYKIKSSQEKLFTYKIRISGRALASATLGLDSLGKKIELGLKEVTNHVSQGYDDDLVLSYTSFGWEMKESDVELVKHSSAYDI